MVFYEVELAVLIITLSSLQLENEDSFFLLLEK